MNGTIKAVFGNMIVARATGEVVQNSVGYCCREDGAKLLSEVIRVRGKDVDLQCFEETGGLKVGDTVEFRDEMLSVELGPGLLGQIYDGLQNPLPRLAEKFGFFLKPGEYIEGLESDRQWEFTPLAQPGDKITSAETLGSVPEGVFTHKIMAPFTLKGTATIKSVAPAGTYTVRDEIAVLTDSEGNDISVTMAQKWPVKQALMIAKERLLPSEPLITKTRIIDSMFPIVKGGTFCVPGPFGAGKTVLQQLMSRYAEVDIVIVAACGERAGEVVETIREFPELTDPRTGKSLMERTIIICNTSAMPVAVMSARESPIGLMMLKQMTSSWLKQPE